MSELVSVIVPVYNVEQYLEKCINSILSQTYSNIELILVDDGSADNSGAMCDEYAKNDIRIKVIHQKNMGLSGARNSGLKIVTGDYISFVDSDDYIDEKYIEILLTRLLEFNADISACGIVRFYESEEINDFEGKNSVKVFNGGEALENNLYQREVANNACAKLYRRQLFADIGFPEGYLYEDLGTTYKLLDISKKVVVDTKKMYFYLQRKNSIMSRDFSERNMDRIVIAEQILSYMKENHPEYINAAISRLFIASVQVLREIPLNDAKYEEDINTIRKYINKYRKVVIGDKNAKMISRLIAFCSYLPLGMFQRLGKIYKKAYQ